jgi:RNA-directed DNA polymerase
MPKEKFKQQTCKNESTDAGHRGGLTGSSDETSVMDVERSGQLIQAN